MDADLLLGLGATLVDEVRAVVEANPYDERAWGQLMVCLYRAGKPAALQLLTLIGRCGASLVRISGWNRVPSWWNWNVRC